MVQDITTSMQRSQCYDHFPMLEAFGAAALQAFDSVAFDAPIALGALVVVVVAFESATFACYISVSTCCI